MRGTDIGFEGIPKWPGIRLQAIGRYESAVIKVGFTIVERTLPIKQAIGLFRANGKTREDHDHGIIFTGDNGFYRFAPAGNEGCPADKEKRHIAPDRSGYGRK